MSAKQEQEWVDAWNDLYDLLRDKRDIKLLLPDWSEVSLDEMLGMLQEAAYRNKAFRFVWVWYKGEKALQATEQE